MKLIKWAYGVLTVPSRRTTLFPATLQSLRAGGFDDPWLFIEGDSAGSAEDYRDTGLHLTFHTPSFYGGRGNLANWILGMWELYLRNPRADRFAMFEDDIECCCNIRQYLESCDYPVRGYWNLYAPSNNITMNSGQRRWQLSLQRGRGALGLVFNRETVATLLGQSYLIQQPATVKGWRNTDGTILNSLRHAGWQEYVHNPSLIQHTGRISVMNHPNYPPSTTFPGRSYDAMELLNEPTVHSLV